MIIVRGIKFEDAVGHEVFRGRVLRRAKGDPVPSKRKLSTPLSIFRAIVKSRFIEMFGESDDCEEVAFGDACVFLRNGATIKQSKNAGGIPITRIETISNNCINEDKFGYANIFDTKAYEKHIMKPGDLLISHINSLPYLGRTVWYHGKPETVIHGMNLLRARLTQEFLPCFVEKYMTTRKAKSYINRHAKKSVNQASISATDLKKMPLPKPSVSKQQEFADFVSQVDKLRFEACYAMYLLCAAFTLL